MNVVALICARAGSKGVPGKNAKPLAGRPLIGWAVAHARAVSRVRRVIVSTDSDAIAALAREAGGETPFLRPEELARDDSPEWLVWRHALDYLKSADGRYPDALLVVPTTSPLRAAADLEKCLDLFGSGGADVVITVTEARRSPYYNMVTLDADGGARLVNRAPGGPHRRQDAPPVYDMTTVGYVARPEFVMQHPGMFAGRVRAVVVPQERALDIDSPLDWTIAECLAARQEGRS